MKSYIVKFKTKTGTQTRSMSLNSGSESEAASKLRSAGVPFEYIIEVSPK